MSACLLVCSIKKCLKGCLKRLKKKGCLVQFTNAANAV